MNILANILRNFDALSFWLGFLGGILLIWIAGRLRPALERLRVYLRAQAQTSRQSKRENDEIRLGNDILVLAQECHIAASMFSLDEILIPPRLLAPPPPPIAYESPPSDDITDWAIPYTQDWPELASYYGAPTLSLSEALEGGANIAITGIPGSGKTVALASLAVQIIRKDPEVKSLEDYVPILVHFGELEITPADFDSPLAPILKVLSLKISSITQKQLPDVVTGVFERGVAILLIDGLDELPPTILSEATQYLERLLKEFPEIKVLVAASPENLGDLLQLGFVPIPVAGWTQTQRETFITKWANLWNRFIAKAELSEQGTADPWQLIGWLLNTTSHLNPLELTLKVWAAFAGDSLGPMVSDALEAHVRRLIHGQRKKNRDALEQLASQIVLAMEPIPGRDLSITWLSGTEMVVVDPGLVEAERELIDGSGGPERSAPVRAGSALPDLIESGLVVLRGHEHISISHSILTGYLAACSLGTAQAGKQLVQQPPWTGRSTTLNYIAIQFNQLNWLEDLVEPREVDPVLSGLFTAARWLRDAHGDSIWPSKILRELAGYLQLDNLPRSLRGRALCALALSGNTGVPALMRQLQASPEPQLRLLAILGSGLLKDLKSVNEICNLLDDRSPNVSRAAILALVAIGDKRGLEAVAYTLLNGDEMTKRAAAEGLANHPEEGYPTLKESSQLEDPGVRRASVFGLARIKQPWAIQILERMRTEDTQWIVQDAANQALASMEGTNPRVPKPLPSLSQTSWLVEFAGERGMGVAPGKPAYELLFRALREGDEDQRLAALYYLSQRGDEGTVLPLYQIYFSNTGDIREASYNAIWNLAATGVELPPPTQYGLK